MSEEEESRMEMGQPVEVHLGLGNFAVSLGEAQGLNENGVTAVTDIVLFINGPHAEYLRELRETNRLQFELERNSLLIPILFFHTPQSRVNLIVHLLEQHLKLVKPRAAADPGQELLLREELDKLLATVRTKLGLPEPPPSSLQEPSKGTKD